MTTPNANDLLMGGGSSAPSLKVGPGKFTDPPTPPHSQPGELKGGKIVTPAEPFKVMKRDRQGNTTSEQDTFPSGDPIWGVVVTVQTTDRDPAIEGDDGKRRVFIDGSMGKDDRLFNSRRRAVRTAVEEAGAPGLEVGGELWLTWTARVDVGGSIPATNWIARYVSPANVALGVTGTPVAAPAAAPAVTQPAPVAQVPAQAAPAPVPVAAPAAPAPAANPAAAALANLTPEQIAAVMQQLGQPPVTA